MQAITIVYVIYVAFPERGELERGHQQLWEDSVVGSSGVVAQCGAPIAGTKCGDLKYRPQRMRAMHAVGWGPWIVAADVEPVGGSQSVDLVSSYS